MRNHLLPTDKANENVQPYLMREPGRHCDGAGLYLEVAAPGQASWMYRYKNRWASLGSANGFSIREAREKADTLWQAARRGEDPFVLLATLRAPKAVPEKPKGKLFAVALAEYLAAKSPSWAASNRARELRHYKYLFGKIPEFTALHLSEINQDAKNKALATWNGQFKAQRDVKLYIAAIIKYADTGELRIRGGGAPEAQHLAAMPWREVPAFYDRISKLNSGGDAVRALRFTILTGARTDEVIGRFERGVWAKARPTWREIVEVDGQATWIIPGTGDDEENFRGMKGKKDHSVPLSFAALALLGERRADDVALFDVPVNGMLKTLKTNGGDGYTVHGFRSSFSDWATVSAGYNADIVDACIAHPDENLAPSKRKVRKSYQRDELLAKRREIMQDWSAFVTGEHSDASLVPDATTSAARAEPANQKE